MTYGSAGGHADKDAIGGRIMGDRVALVLIARKENSGILAQITQISPNPQEPASQTAFQLGQREYLRTSAFLAVRHVKTIRETILDSRDRLTAYAVMPVVDFQPQLVVFDTDSTFIDQEVIDEIADFAGMKPQVAKITELAMQGKLDFNAALQERVALLKDLPEDTLAKVLHTRLTVTQGGAELVRELSNAGAKTYLLSGGFSFFTSALRRQYGLTGDFANELEIEAGRLTGRTRGPIVNRVRKANLLREIAEKGNIPLERTVAIGDGANDIDMAESSGLGIAFCAKPALYEATSAAIFERDLRFVARLIYPS